MQGEFQAATNAAAMKALELKIPPVIWVVMHLAVMHYSAGLLPALNFQISRLWSLLALSLGLAVALSGIAAFRAAKTTVNPLQPGQASSLVIVGIYRFTRNPMYVGALFVLTAWFLFLQNWLPMLFLGTFVWILTRLQIKPEERVLIGRFGEEYAAYCRRVPRWIGF